MDLHTRQEEIINLLNGLDEKGIFSFVALTGKTALKKSRITKEPTPANLVTVTKLMYATVSLGNNYQTAVNNRLKKEGKEATFESKGSYCSPVSGNGIIYKHNERNTFYLRVYPNLCHSFKTVVKYFDNEGKVIENWKEIEAEYFNLPHKNTNQGLDDPIVVNNYEISGLRYLKRGSFSVNELDQDIIDKLSA